MTWRCERTKLGSYAGLDVYEDACCVEDAIYVLPHEIVVGSREMYEREGFEEELRRLVGMVKV